MSIVSTALTLVLDSASGTIDLNYPVNDNVVLTLTNVLISFDSSGDSGTAGPVIYCDLGELTSHTALNGNLNSQQVLVLTNNDTFETSRYSPQIPVGVDKSVPSRITYKLMKPDGSLLVNMKTVVLQFAYSFLEKK